MKKIYIYLFLSLALIPGACIYAEEQVNSGFIPGQIWYSSQNLVEGQTVNIHTAIWNGDKNSLSAKVEFYDKNVILGSRDVVVNPLELKDISVPWKITSGDHTISAKITTSTTLVSGKKENITLENNTTSNDKQYVSVTIKDESGKAVSGQDIVKNKINQTGSDLDSIIPEKISPSLKNIFNKIDNFRNETYIKLALSKEETKNELKLIKNKVTTVEESKNDKSNIEDAVKKPITNIKLFLLIVLTLIFMVKIVFYALFVFFVFLILRFIYRKIRNR